MANLRETYPGNRFSGCTVIKHLGGGKEAIHAGPAVQSYISVISMQIQLSQEGLNK